MLYGIQTQKQYRIIQKERNQWANNDMILPTVRKFSKFVIIVGKWFTL